MYWVSFKRAHKNVIICSDHSTKEGKHSCGKTRHGETRCKAEIALQSDSKSKQEVAKCQSGHWILYRKVIDKGSICTLWSGPQHFQQIMAHWQIGDQSLKEVDGRYN